MKMAKHPTVPLARAQMSAVLHEGITVTLADGRKGQLAIVDDSGAIVECGPNVATHAWNLTADCIDNMLRGMGHLRTYTPKSQPIAEAA